MKNVITAMGDKYLNDKLRKENIKVFGKDIQYLEGIFEQLEENKDVNLIIISSKLVKEDKYNELLYKLNLINKKIKIIFILDKRNNKLINLLKNKNIKFYLTLNKKNIYHLIKYIKLENIKLNKKIKYNILKKYKNSNCKVITTTGPSGVGKTTFIKIFSKLKKEKTLIIDLDKDKNSLYTLYNVNKKQIKNNIFKIEKNVDLLTINSNNLIKINNNINKYKNSYKYIVIDLASFIRNYKIKDILNNSNLIIFITEGNLLQLKKSKKLLEYYQNRLKIKNVNIKIILNKINKNTINKEIIKNTLNNLEYLGQISLNINYDNLINNNFNNFKLYPKIEKELKKIITKI